MCAPPSHGMAHTPDILVMPNRIIRESINDSETVNALSMRSELFYRRLQLVVDDYGRYEARLPILRVRLFGLQLEQWPEAEIHAALKECNEACRADGTPLVRLYEKDRKVFLEVTDFRQPIRIKHKKYPEPQEGTEVCVDSLMRSRCTADAKRMHVSSNPIQDPDPRSKQHTQNGTCNNDEAFVCAEPLMRSTCAPENNRPVRENVATQELTVRYDPDPLWRIFRAKYIGHPHGVVEGGPEARAIWMRTVTSEAYALQIISGLDTWIAGDRWSRGIGIPNPDRFLREHWYRTPPPPAPPRMESKREQQMARNLAWAREMDARMAAGGGVA